MGLEIKNRLRRIKMSKSNAHELLDKLADLLEDHQAWINICATDGRIKLCMAWTDEEIDLGMEFDEKELRAITKKWEKDEKQTDDSHAMRYISLVPCKPRYRYNWGAGTWSQLYRLTIKQTPWIML